jgi:hypothetical protein
LRPPPWRPQPKAHALLLARPPARLLPPSALASCLRCGDGVYSRVRQSPFASPWHAAQLTVKDRGEDSLLTGARVASGAAISSSCRPAVAAARPCAEPRPRAARGGRRRRQARGCGAGRVGR